MSDRIKALLEEARPFWKAATYCGPDYSDDRVKQAFSNEPTDFGGLLRALATFEEPVFRSEEPILEWPDYPEQGPGAGWTQCEQQESNPRPREPGGVENRMFDFGNGNVHAHAHDHVHDNGNGLVYENGNGNGNE